MFTLTPLGPPSPRLPAAPAGPWNNNVKFACLNLSSCTITTNVHRDKLECNHTKQRCTTYICSGCTR